MADHERLIPTSICRETSEAARLKGFEAGGKVEGYHVCFTGMNARSPTWSLYRLAQANGGCYSDHNMNGAVWWRRGMTSKGRRPEFGGVGWQTLIIVLCPCFPKVTKSSLNRATGIKTD